MKSKRITKILGIGLSAGLIFALIGAVFAAPVSADMMKWGIVNTPSWEDYEIFPDSDIMDYAVGGDGDTVYAVVTRPNFMLGSGTYAGTGGSASWSTAHEVGGSYSALL